MSCCPSDVARRLNVSRETLDRLELYVSLLEKWNARINLVARGTVSKLWTRHILDSAQVFQLGTGQHGRWVDLGSGGGFPGMVVALMAADLSERQVTLVESDQRKAAFLRSVARECQVDVRVLAQRIEEIAPLNASAVSARALTSLPGLLEYSDQHLSPDGIALFLKGEKASEEVATARKTWSFNCETIASITDATASILKIGDIKRV